MLFVPICATTHYMSLNKSVSVRFDDNTEDRLDALASKTGLSKADLVRRAAVSYLDTAEKTGEITLALREPVAAPSNLKTPAAGSGQVLYNLRKRVKDKAKGKVNPSECAPSPKSL